MGAVFKKEMKAYFRSPIAYIFLAIMMFFSALAFVFYLANGYGQISYVFSFLISIVIIVIPILTMRLLSEEKKLKTDQLLLTSPVSLNGVVLGKYFASLVMFLIGMTPTILYMIILSFLSKPNWNIFVGNFLGLALLGAALISIGLFISSVTESQVIAAIGTIAAIYLITLFDTIASSIPTSLKFIASIFTGLSFMSRYDDMVSGILNVSNILFFVSIVVAFNFLTVRILEKKRWS